MLQNKLSAHILSLHDL